MNNNKLVLELLSDTTFKKGFKIRYPFHVNDENEDLAKVIALTTDKPDWFISQWFTKFTIANGIINKSQDKLEIIDDSKKVIVTSGKIYLEINGIKEYDKPRTSVDPWPHLLLEQNFSDKKLSDYETMTMNINFDYLLFHDYMQTTIDPNIHTAQFQWFLNIGNRNKKSKGYGDFFWFGLSFLDTPRYDFPPAFMEIDGGKEDATKKFICIVDSRKYLKQAIKLNDNVNVSFEIFQLINEGFTEAKKRGFLKDTNYEDLELNSTNIGFELTGTFAIGLRINQIGLLAQAKNSEKNK